MLAQPSWSWHSGPLLPHGYKYYARGQINTMNQELEPFKVQIILVDAVSQIFWHLSTLRWFPMVWIPSPQDRTQSSHVSHFPLPPWCSHVTQVLLIRCTDRDLDREVSYVRKQVGCRAFVLQAQMVGRGSVVLESSAVENSFPASSAQRFWGLFRACFFTSSKDCEYSKSLLNYFLL